MDPMAKSAIDAVRAFANFAAVNLSGAYFSGVVPGEFRWSYFRLADLRWGLC